MFKKERDEAFLGPVMQFGWGTNYYGDLCDYASHWFTTWSRSITPVSSNVTVIQQQYLVSGTGFLLCKSGNHKRRFPLF